MIPRRALSLLLAAALLAAAPACGGDDSASSDAGADPSTPVDQTIEVTMKDFSFEPATLTVKAGTTVRFRFHNEGSFVHDAAFGDEAVQKAVEENKAKREGPEVRPKKSKDYVRRFDSPGQLIIGCHQPGHYPQGMQARLTVA